jgi:hypothetical protein
MQRNTWTHPHPPPKYICLFGGLSSIYSTHWRGVQGLMWGARGVFLPAAAMVVAVVMPVVFICSVAGARARTTLVQSNPGILGTIASTSPRQSHHYIGAAMFLWYYEWMSGTGFLFLFGSFSLSGREFGGACEWVFGLFLVLVTAELNLSCNIIIIIIILLRQVWMSWIHGRSRMRRSITCGSLIG